MGAKQDFGQLNTDITNWRSKLDSMRPEYGAQRGALTDWRTNRLQPVTDQAGAYTQSIKDWRTADRPDFNLVSQNYRDMITDPSKRGFSDATTGKMFSRQADVLGGAKSQYENNVRRNIAATGMGSTGAGIRALQSYEPGFQSSLRSSMRDIDLENENLKRSELFKSMEGLQGQQAYMDELQKSGLGLEGQGIGLQGQFLDRENATFDQYLKNLMGETSVVEGEGQNFDVQESALEQKNKPGFWSSLLKGALNSAIGGFTGGLGTGIGSSVFKNTATPKPVVV